MWIHSIFHAFMLQCYNQFIPLQITETFVELNEEYKVKNILKKWMISEKFTISSSEKNIIPLRTHENHEKTLRTVWGHFDILRKKDRVSEEWWHWVNQLW
jgi:sulfur carrier protein ThiS